MSKNLYKSHWIVVKENSKSIDSNELMARKLEEIANKIEQQAQAPGAREEGFTEGIFADELGVLLADEDGSEGASVIKAAELPDLEEIQAQADAIMQDADTQARAIMEQARIDAEREAQRIREMAREQGYQEGMDAVAQKEMELEQRYRERNQVLENQYQEQLDEMEPAIVEALTEIYEHVFNVELQQYRQIIIQLISATMRKVEENKNFLVHVAKEDYAFVSMNKKALQEAGGSGKANVEIVEDITLSRNQCMLETENGIFDCGLDTQLAELTRKLRLLSYERRS